MDLRIIKMQGCGNDFLFMDYIQGDAPNFYPREVRYLCDRHFGLGADGLVILQKSPEAHAQWKFYNSDGSEAEMCGNAARCAIKYLSERYYPHDVPITLQTKAGLIKGKPVEHSDLIEVTLSPNHFERFEYDHKIIATDKYSLEVYFINTGVPHAVIEVKDIMTYPILQVGQDLRHHPTFGPEGTNVTFYQRLVGSRIRSTTYERGVENETMACGTGAAAAAVIYSEVYLQPMPIEVHVPGGDLIVDLSPVSKMLLLQGPARYVFDINITDIPPGFESLRLFSSRVKEAKE